MEQRGFVFHRENLLSPAEAVATFLSRVPLSPSGNEMIALEDAYGRVLAKRLDADNDYPSAARSAMDGFAVAAASTPGTFRIVGEIQMGRAWTGRLGDRETLRIPTGGVVPDGADAVVPVEDCNVDGNAITVGTTPVGDSITPRGSDMHSGETVLAAGTRIQAAHLGVLATIGVTRVPVYRRPVVGIVSSGDELVAPSSSPQPGEVRDSNRYAIAGALVAMGAIPRHFPTMRDTPGLLEAALRQALGQCDAVVMSGGSSVGERDYTPRAIATLGEPGIIVHGLRVKPGKPTAFAAIGAKPILGLPGNPNSALMILEAVAAPIVAGLVGAPLQPNVVQATLAHALAGRRGWTWFVPVALRHEGEGWTAHPLPLRSSSVSLAARADGYVTMRDEDEAWDAGRTVSVTRFV
jgi:molybdenum cofactor synthesis domain-containing protein